MPSFANTNCLNIDRFHNIAGDAELIQSNGYEDVWEKRNRMMVCTHRIYHDEMGQFLFSWTSGPDICREYSCETLLSLEDVFLAP